MKKEDKHQKILDSAIKVFGDKGFFNARISDIAKEAKVADGTIYLYFNNKYDILLTLFEEEIQKLIIQIKDALAEEEDPRRMLHIFALNHMKLVIEKKELAEVLQMELRQSSQPIIQYRNTSFADYVNIISDIIHMGQEMNIFRTDLLPGIAKRAFFGALDEMSRLWILNPKHTYSITETAEQIADIFLNGIVEVEQQGKSSH
jgi:TetR/AcrR family fatty acid metabolism transcriptional regulator